MQCEECSLRKEAEAPVPPSVGLWNIMVLAEAPGPKEDEIGEGLVGASGNLLWTSIGKKKYPRELFHVTNVNKCYPSNSRKPNKEQVKICGKLFLSRELKMVKPVVVLALGNTPLLYLTGQPSGIMAKSGMVEWNEEYSTWIVWCLHPAATLHNPDNKNYFDLGIKQFKKTLRALGGQGLAKT